MKKVITLITILTFQASISQNKTNEIDSLLNSYTALNLFFPSENILKNFVGTYEISEDYIVNVKLIKGNLYFQINNENELKLRAEKESQFFIQDENISIEFFKQDSNKQKIKIKEGLSTKIGDKIKN